ncbi:uncharacterized protein VNE69_01322 [Vairimorpha necatrix]|uniref:Uncharacterized protein n=1 Tax=Vairimorpha necatrix TaxID=6039 RepID=A0AAX4J8S7_9MICR
MNISKFLFAIVFVGANHNLLDGIVNEVMYKIEEGDYISLDLKKEYSSVSISPGIVGHIGYSINDIYNDIYPFERDLHGHVFCGKNLLETINEYKRQIAKSYRSKLTDSIILIYNRNELERYIDCAKTYTIRDVIKASIKIHKERHSKKQIHFEYICEKKSYLAEAIKEMVRIRHLTKLNSCIPDSYIKIDKNLANNDHSIRFRINIEDIYYFFEINIRELSNTIIPITIDKNKLEDKVFAKCVCLLEDRNNKFPFIHSNNVIRNLIDENYKLEKNNIDKRYIVDESKRAKLETEKIIDKLHKYFIADKKYTNIDDQGRNEIMNLLIKISALSKIEYYECTELFYFLLENNKQTEFFIRRILENANTGLNTLLTHFLIIIRIIDKNELNIIIEKEKSNASKREEIVQNIINLLHWPGEISYHFLKIVLLIYVEEYMNENDVSKNGFLKTLEDVSTNIGYNGNTKEHNKSREKQDVNLLQVLNFIILKLKEHHEKSLQKIYAIISLLSGSTKTFLLSHKTGKFEMIEKNKIFEEIKLQNLKVEEAIDNIRKKLTEKAQEKKNKK